MQPTNNSPIYSLPLEVLTHVLSFVPQSQTMPVSYVKFFRNALLANVEGRVAFLKQTLASAFVRLDQPHPNCTLLRIKPIEPSLEKLAKEFIVKDPPRKMRYETAFQEAISLERSYTTHQYLNTNPSDFEVFTKEAVEQYQAGNPQWINWWNRYFYLGVMQVAVDQAREGQPQLLHWAIGKQISIKPLNEDDKKRADQYLQIIAIDKCRSDLQRTVLSYLT